MTELETNKLDQLEIIIKECGDFAVEMQSKIHRSFKSDGSVLTETDLEISHRVIKAVETLFPHERIISEEEESERRESASYIFVLDPIDGTDVYSQGLPSFAVSLGILNKALEPVGAMIYAPRFGLGSPSLFVRLDPNNELLVNGEPFKESFKFNGVKQVCMGSKCQRLIDFSSYKGKCRTFGSTIIHLLLSGLLPTFQGAIAEPCFVWDITSSHAVLKYLKQDISYRDGSPFSYTDDFVFNKKPFRMAIYSGCKEAREEMLRLLPYKK